MPSARSQPIGLTIRDGPAVVALERLSIGTAVVRLADVLVPGRWVHAELQHPSFGAITTAAHVAWAQQIAPGLPLTLAGLEFVGTWEKLAGLRRAVLGVVASDAFAGDAPLGWVTPEPDGTWTCFSRDAIKVGLVSADKKAFSVRRRDHSDPAGVLLAGTTFLEAVARAFARADGEGVRLDPPLGPTSGAPARPVTSKYDAKGLAARAGASGVTPPSRPPAPARKVEEKKRPAPVPISESAEEVILAAQTIMVPLDDSSDEAQILAARTIRVDDDAPPPESARGVRGDRVGPPESEEDVLAARTLVLPKDRVAPKEPAGPERRWSKVFDGSTQLGWIAPDTPTAWTIYDDKRRKIAVAAVESGKVRVCWLGDKSTESFEYFEAPTAGEAIAAAFELDHPPKIDPPL